MAALTGCSLFATPQAWATDYTWDGGAVGVNALWNVANNWNPNGVPTMNSGNGLIFAGATKLNNTNDFAVGSDINTIVFSSGASSFTLAGNQLDVFTKIENSDDSLHTLNLPITAAGSYLEVNPVSGDLALGGVITNNNELRVWGDNSHVLTISGTVTGSGKLIVKQYSLVKITGNSAYSGNTEIDEGEFWIGAGGAVGGGTIYVGNGGAQANVTKLWLSDMDGGLTCNEPLSVNAGNANTRYIGGLNTSGTNFYSGTLALSSQVNLEANDAAGAVEFAGVISGASQNIVCSGAGTVRLTTDNTFTGGAYLTKGTTVVTSSDPFDGNVYIGETSGSDNATLGIGGSSTLDTTVEFRSGSSGIKKIAAYETSTISAGVVISELDNDQVEVDAASGKTLTMSGVISGDSGGGEITKTGAGTLTISNSGNTHDKKVTVSAGTLSISASRNLGADPGGAYADKLTLNGGTLKATASFTMHVNNSTTLGASGGTLDVDPTYTLTYSPVISGSGALTKSGGGTLTLSAANTYSGDSTISAGRLKLGAAGVIPDGSGKGDVTVTGTLDMNGFSETINGLSGAGAVDNSSAGTYTLTVGNDNDTSTFSGAISNTAGTVALTKTGTGTLTLSGASTYSGNTTVSAGALIHNGTNTSSAVTVSVGGTLRGAGSVGSTTVAGEIDPGSAASTVGNLSASALALSAQGTNRVTITDVDDGAGVGWDVITVGGGSGTVTINSTAGGNEFVILIDTLGGTPTGWNTTSTYSWVIMDAGTLSGFDTSKFTIVEGPGTTLTDGGTFSLENSSGNLVLKYTGSPADSCTTAQNTYNSSGTFTASSGVYSVTVEAWGGGGGGAGNNGLANSGVGGGGGGAYSRKVVAVSPGSSYTVTVGAGGTSTVAGADSWFQATTNVLAKGGAGGTQNNTAGAAGGASGSGVGDTKYSGGTGANGAANTYGGGGGSSAGTNSAGTAATVAAGASAPSGGGNGGDGKTNPSGSGNDGSVPGGGGGGAYRGNAGTYYGGTGATGKVVVTFCYQAPAAGIVVLGTNTALKIADNDATPTRADGTDFGDVLVAGGTKEHTFTVTNTGAGNLSMARVAIGGTHAADFTVTQQPVGINSNLLLNGDFSMSGTSAQFGSAVISNWTIYGTDGWYQDDLDSRMSVKMWWDTGGLYQNWVCVPGNRYDISVYARQRRANPITNWHGYVRVEFYNTASSCLASQELAYISSASATDQWILLSGNYTAPAGSVTGRVILGMNNWAAGVSGDAYFDDASVVCSNLPSGSTTTFRVTFDPSASGTRTAAVYITNNVTSKNPYDFVIQGTGIIVGGGFSYTVDVDNVVSDGQVTGGVFEVAMSFYDTNGMTTNANYDLLNPGGTQILTDEQFNATAFQESGRLLVAADSSHKGYYPGDLGTYTSRWSAQNSNAVWMVNSNTLMDAATSKTVFAVVDDDTAAPTPLFDSPNLLTNAGFEICVSNGATPSGWWDGGTYNDTAARQWNYAKLNGSNGYAFGSWVQDCRGFFGQTVSNSYTDLSIGDIIEFKIWAFCENNFTSSTKEAYINLQFQTNDLSGDAEISLISSNRIDIYDTLVSQRGAWQQITVSVTCSVANVHVIKPRVGYDYAVDSGTLIGMSVFWDDAVLVKKGSKSLELAIGTNRYAGSDNSTNAMFYVDTAAMSNVVGGTPLRVIFSAYDASDIPRSTTADTNSYMNVDVGRLCTNNTANYVSGESTADGSLTNATSTWYWSSITLAQFQDMTNAITNRIYASMWDNDQDRTTDRMTRVDQQFGALVITNKNTVVSNADMAVLGTNGALIVNNDITPSTADGTDFGTILGAAIALTNTFTITNAGNASLTLQNVAFSTNSGLPGPSFSIFAQPSTPVATGAVTTFKLKFAPTNIGRYVATFIITNSTAYKTPYRFIVEGTYFKTAPSYDDPTGCSVVTDGYEMVRLAFTPNATSDVLITYRGTNASTVNPTQGVAYDAGDAVGSDGTKVLYKGHRIRLEHIIGVDRTFHYKFYSTSNDYYSSGTSPVSVTTGHYQTNEYVDSVAYTNGLPLSGLNGGNGWVDGWTADSQFSVVSNVIPLRPTFTNAPVEQPMAGNRIRKIALGVGINQHAAYRHFAPVTNGTIYFSGFVAYANDGVDKWAGFSVMSGTTHKVMFGKTWADEHLLGIADYSGGSGHKESATEAMNSWNENVTNANFIVGKYDFSTRTFSANIWRREVWVPGTEPASWMVSDTLDAGYLNSIDGMGIKCGNNVTPEIGDCYFDELRVATSWKDLFGLTVPALTNYSVNTSNYVSDALITSGVFEVTATAEATNGIGTATFDFDLMNPSGIQILTNESFSSQTWTNTGRTSTGTDPSHAGHYPADLGTYTGRWSVASSNGNWTYDAVTLSNGTPTTFIVYDDDTTAPSHSGFTGQNRTLDGGSFTGAELSAGLVITGLVTDAGSGMYGGTSNQYVLTRDGSQVDSGSMTAVFANGTAQSSNGQLRTTLAASAVQVSGTYTLRVTSVDYDIDGNSDQAATTSFYVFTVVANLVDPTGVRALVDGNEMVRLDWTNAPGYGVIIVHKRTNAPTALTQGTPYIVGDAVGSDGSRVVAKQWTGTWVEHIVPDGSTNFYTFYTYTNDTYSSGVTASTNTESYDTAEIVDEMCYTNALVLTNRSGGHGWSAAWNAWPGFTIVTNDTPSRPEFFNMTGYPNRGGDRIHLDAPGGNVAKEAYRNFPAVSTGLVYLAGRVSFQNTGANRWCGFSVVSGATHKVFFGEAWAGNGLLGISDYGSGQTGTNVLAGWGAALTNTYVIIARYNFDTRSFGAVAFPGWMSVTPDEPIMPVSDTIPANYMNTIDGIGLKAGSDNAGADIGECYWDEIRVAFSWSELLRATIPVLTNYSAGAGYSVYDGQITSGVFTMSATAEDTNGIGTAGIDFDVFNPSGVQIVTNEHADTQVWTNGGKTSTGTDTNHAGYYPGDLGTYTARWSAVNSNGYWLYDRTSLSNGTLMTFGVVDDDTVQPTFASNAMTRPLAVVMGTNFSDGGLTTNAISTVPDGLLVSINTNNRTTDPSMESASTWGVFGNADIVNWSPDTGVSNGLLVGWATNGSGGLYQGGITGTPGAVYRMTARLRKESSFDPTNVALVLEFYQANDATRAGSDGGYTNVALQMTASYQTFTTYATAPTSTVFVRPVITFNGTNQVDTGANEAAFVDNITLDQVGMRLVFSGYDTDSGLQRANAGTSATNMNVDVGSLVTDNIANYDPSISSSTSTGVLTTSVWQWASAFSAADIQTLYTSGSNSVQASLFDADQDRSGDQALTTNSLFGYLKVSDDDTNGPQFGTSIGAGGAAMDFTIGGTSYYQSGSGTAVVMRVTDADMVQVSAANPMRFIFDVFDPHSGVRRANGGSDTTNLNYDVGTLASATNLFTTYSGVLSSANTVWPGATSVFYHTAPFTYSATFVAGVGEIRTGELAQLITAATNRITVSANNLDEDRGSVDVESFTDWEAGRLVVADDDVDGPTNWLLYVGTNFTGASNTVSITDGDFLNDSIDFAYIWSDPSGLLVTNVGNTANNIGSLDGNVMMNYDFVTPAGVTQAQDIVHTGVYPKVNGATMVTVVEYNVAQIVYTNNELGAWYITASAQDLDSDWPLVTNSANNNIVSPDRSVRTNLTMNFAVRDDDSNYPKAYNLTINTKVLTNLFTDEEMSTGFLVRVRLGDEVSGFYTSAANGAFSPPVFSLLNASNNLVQTNKTFTNTVVSPIQLQNGGFETLSGSTNADMPDQWDSFCYELSVFWHRSNDMVRSGQYALSGNFLGSGPFGPLVAQWVNVSNMAVGETLVAGGWLKISNSIPNDGRTLIKFEWWDTKVTNGCPGGTQQGYTIGTLFTNTGNDWINVETVGTKPTSTSYWCKIVVEATFLGNATNRIAWDDMYIGTPVDLEASRAGVTVPYSNFALGTYSFKWTGQDSDNDRTNDTLGYTDNTNVLYSSNTYVVIDDDSNNPVAVDLWANGADADTTNAYVSDQQVHIGLWPMSFRFMDYSGVATDSSQGWLPNYSFINSGGVTVNANQAFNSLVEDGSKTNVIATRAMGGVAYSDVTLGNYQIVWSAQDRDNDRADDWMARTNTGYFDPAYGTNIVYVYDDDTNGPSLVTTVQVDNVAWTNVNLFNVTFNAATDDYSGIYEYRYDTNTTPSTAVADGVAISGVGTSTLAIPSSNLDFEVGQNGNVVPDNPGMSNSWQDFSSDNATGQWTSAQHHSGTNAMRHLIAAGYNGVHIPRYTLVSQMIDIGNTNGYPVRASLSGWFKGDMSTPGNGATGAAFLKMEFFNSATTQIQTVDNEYGTDHNGAPLFAVNAAAWTNVMITATNGPASTRFIRFICGAGQHGTELGYDVFWDDLVITVKVIGAVGNAYSFTVTNVLEGIRTNSLFANDDDDDRVSDRAKGLNTNFITKLDLTPPAKVTGFTGTNGTDEATEINLNWTAAADAGSRAGDNEPLSPWRTYYIFYEECTNCNVTVNSPSKSFTNGLPSLNTNATASAIFSNLNFDSTYRFVIAGQDRAGNLSTLSSTVDVTTLAFIVTQGMVSATSSVALSWMASPAKTYDTLWVDGTSYGDSYSNQWTNLMGTVTNSWIEDGGATNRVPPKENVTTMRFYRVSREGQWVTNAIPRRASREIYVARTWWLRPGENWISLPFAPDSNRYTVAHFFGTNLLPRNSTIGISTKISWYGHTLGTGTNSAGVATNEIWLSSANRWYYWLPVALQGQVADDWRVPTNEGFNIEIPVGSATQKVVIVGRLPTNNMTMSIYGATSQTNFSVLSWGVPQRVRVMDLGLIGASFSGGVNVTRSDELRILDNSRGMGSMMMPKVRLWRNGSTTNFYYSPGNGLANDYIIEPGDAIIIVRKRGPSLTWTNRLIYTVPGKNINP